MLWTASVMVSSFVATTCLLSLAVAINVTLPAFWHSNLAYSAAAIDTELCRAGPVYNFPLDFFCGGVLRETV